MATRYAVLVAIMLGVAPAATAQQVADPTELAAPQVADLNEVPTQRVVELGKPPAPVKTAGLPLAYFDQAYMHEACNAAMRAEVARILEAAGVPVDDLTEAALTGGRRSELGINGERRKSLTDEEIGRALGRIVVHELVHAFAPDHEHGGWGIMGHAQDRQSLTVAGATLDEQSASALLNGWSRAKQLSAGGY